MHTPRPNYFVHQITRATDLAHNNNGFNAMLTTSSNSTNMTEELYARGFNAGRAFYERTQEGAGANQPRCNYRYDSPESNAWHFGYSHGWELAKREHERARAVYETDRAEY